MTPDEIRAAAETHRELGPDYQSAVIESFLDKIGREIDARVDQRVTLTRPVKQPRGRAPLALAIVSLVLGIPLSAIALGVGSHSTSGIVALVVIWISITAIKLAYSLGGRPPPGRPPYGL